MFEGLETKEDIRRFFRNRMDHIKANIQPAQLPAIIIREHELEPMIQDLWEFIQREARERNPEFEPK